MTAFLRVTLLLLLALPAALAQDIVLVPVGSQWKYLDNGTDQGTAWRAPEFDDTTWSSGAAELGYGDGGEATVVSFGPNPDAKYITTYFRRAFQVTDPAAYSGLNVRLKRDDGAVVYLNGTRIVRSNMRSGAITFSTLASTTIGAGEENDFNAFSVSSAALVAGINVLAVEVHQVSAISPDLSFDLELVATPVGPTQITRGPYLQTGTPTSVIVRWRTNVPTSSRVLFGPNVGNLTASAGDPTLTTEHIVALTGLTANTTYFYAIGDALNVYAGDDAQHHFRTAPVVGTLKPTRVWILGDSGTGGSGSGQAEAVRDAYLYSPIFAPIDVWLMLGDNAYDTGTDEEYQRAVYETYDETLRQTVLWPTIGNHDTAFNPDPTPQIPYFNMFSLPMNGEAGGFASGTEKYYSFDYANIHFICVDSMSSSRLPGSPMLTWLEEDISSTVQKWIIAYWHHPPYTKGSHNSDVEHELIEMREHVLPILEAGGVDLVLSGHSHCYERSFLIDGHYGLSSTFTEGMKRDGGDGRETGGSGAYGKDPVPNAGTVYTVAGSSGRISGGTFNHPIMVTSMPVLGSLVLDVHGDKLSARFLDATGTVRDDFAISKAPLVQLAPASSLVHESPAESVNVTLTRTRNLSTPLTVSLAVGGTASANDYQLAIGNNGAPGSNPTPITFGVGVSSIVLNVRALSDASREDLESVVLAAENGIGYRTRPTTRTANVFVSDSAMGDWRFAKFALEAANPLVAGDLADPDRDGISNLLERGFGLEPLTASRTGLPVAAAGNHLALSFQRSPAASDLRFTVQVSNDLQTWNSGSSYLGSAPSSPNPFTTEVSRSGANPELITVRDNFLKSSQPRRFIRLEVTRP